MPAASYRGTCSCGLVIEMPTEENLRRLHGEGLVTTEMLAMMLNDESTRAGCVAGEWAKHARGNHAGQDSALLTVERKR